jgi:hypothetical protein
MQFDMVIYLQPLDLKKFPHWLFLLWIYLTPDQYLSKKLAYKKALTDGDH